MAVHVKDTPRPIPKSRFWNFAWLCLLILFSLQTTWAQAQQQGPGPAAASPASPTAAQPLAEPASSDTSNKRYDTPEGAYDGGAYDQALEGFVDLQVERPEDPALLMNIGSTHYRMKNYGEAEKAFSQAALRGDSKLRSQAYYNLGGVAFSSR